MHKFCVASDAMSITFSSDQFAVIEFLLLGIENILYARQSCSSKFQFSSLERRIYLVCMYAYQKQSHI